MRKTITGEVSVLQQNMEKARKRKGICLQQPNRKKRIDASASDGV